MTKQGQSFFLGVSFPKLLTPHTVVTPLENPLSNEIHATSEGVSYFSMFLINEHYTECNLVEHMTFHVNN